MSDECPQNEGPAAERQPAPRPVEHASTMLQRLSAACVATKNELTSLDMAYSERVRSLQMAARHHVTRHDVEPDGVLDAIKIESARVTGVLETLNADRVCVLEALSRNECYTAHDAWRCTPVVRATRALLDAALDHVSACLEDVRKAADGTARADAALRVTDARAIVDRLRGELDAAMIKPVPLW